MTAITLSDVTVRRGGRPIVDGLSLTIRPGAVFWIVGPNGAGKSSLLRVIAGLDRPAAGTAARWTDGPAFRYFHSEMSLPGWTTVGTWDRLVESLLPGPAPVTGLRPALGPRRWIRRLSTGERKRLLLDALVRTPGPLLLDEPYEHLSPGAKRTLSELLRQRARTDAVVVVTNQATRRAEAETGVRIEDGRVVRLGRAATDDAGGGWP